MSLITQYNNRCTRKKKLCNFAVIGSNNVKTVADRYIHAAYHNKHWWQAFYCCQRWWPWTLKI